MLGRRILLSPLPPEEARLVQLHVTTTSSGLLSSSAATRGATQAQEAVAAVQAAEDSTHAADSPVYLQPSHSHY